MLMRHIRKHHTLTRNIFPPSKDTPIVIGMSGGVDSSVVAHILRSQGYTNLQAIFMRNWDTRDERGDCPSEKDFRDVQKVCNKLNIPCHEINLVKQYWNRVFSATLDDYARGMTPNPDILCNKEIKFGVLLDEIHKRLPSLNAWFATGHYARAVHLQGEVGLFRGSDKRKDQSYYLASVSSQKLDRAVFPLGLLDKARDVRRIAQEANLHNAMKEESMGICFVGERRRFDQFLAQYLPQTEGDILSSEGLVLGRHGGLFTKTIGQNAGLAGWHEKWYIYEKNVNNNCMYAVQGRDNPLLLKREIHAGQIHWISRNGAPKGFDTGEKLQLEAQIRHMQSPKKCTVHKSTQDTGALCAVFDEPQFGVAPGQYMVLYSDDQCLGSACIL